MRFPLLLLTVALLGCVGSPPDAGEEPAPGAPRFWAFQPPGPNTTLLARLVADEDGTLHLSATPGVDAPAASKGEVCGESHWRVERGGETVATSEAALAGRFWGHGADTFVVGGAGAPTRVANPLPDPILQVESSADVDVKAGDVLVVRVGVGGATPAAAEPTLKASRVNLTQTNLVVVPFACGLGMDDFAGQGMALGVPAAFIDARLTKEASTASTAALFVTSDAGHVSCEIRAGEETIAASEGSPCVLMTPARAGEVTFLLGQAAGSRLRVAWFLGDASDG